MYDNTFNQDNAKGKEGESFVINTILSSPKVNYWIDTSSYKPFQNKGYDFVYELVGDDRLYKLEVKTTLRNKETIIIEEFIDSKTKKLGWFHTTKANYIIYINKQQTYYVWLILNAACRAKIESMMEEQIEIMSGLHVHAYTPCSNKTGNSTNVFRVLPLAELVGYYKLVNIKK